MNHIYRLVWNHLTHAWVCCAETAKGRGKTGSGRNSRVTGRVAGHATALATGALASSLALAAPTGGQVSAGSGSIAQSGHTTTIIQTSQNLAINWQGFDIAANEAVRFNQPNAASVALNRVTGQNPSQILGSLSANGQVFVLNPNGVLFGAGAQVNVGGLVASTLGLSDADLMASRYTFNSSSRSIDGAVVNKGTLTSVQGGYIALLAPEVRNEGVITATLGTALLAAGDKVSLNLNNGSLLGYSIDQGALKALADNRQLIQANGGTVILSAKAADALSQAVVNNTGIIEARTLNKVGGVIKLMGDMEVGTMHVGGTLDASAPAFAASAAPTEGSPPVGAATSANGGTAQGTANGGFIETSAAHVKIADSVKITTKAANGLTGSWLIDPVDFTIAATGGDMTAATLTSNLASSNVLIQSTSGANGTSGNVNVNDTVSWSTNKLTLNAQNNIHINANLNASGTASLALEYGQGAVAAGNTSSYFLNNGAQVNLPAGQNFSTKLGSDGVITNYTVITALGAEGSTTATDLQGMNGNLAGKYALGANIDASPTSNWNAGAGFAPVGSLSGSFNGLGHTISNLYINSSRTYDVGLFSRIESSSTIRNVGLVGGSVTGTYYVGGLVGYNLGSISNSYATGMVTGSNYVGGLVGASQASISRSYATGSVSGRNSVGGLVGWIAAGAISDSYAIGNVTGIGSADGGLVGKNSGSISNAYATGAVTGNSGVGGLVGWNYSGSISNAYATGAVTGSASVGGLVGYRGGFSSLISTSYWNTTTSGRATSAGGIGMATVDMQTQANFTSATAANGNVNPNWDFTNTWVMYDGHTYPLLRSFMTPLTVTADNITKTYNGQNASASGVSYSSTPNANLLGTLGYSDTRNAGTYSIGGLYSNQQGYILSYVGGTLTVNKANLTLSANDITKTYDGGLGASGTATVSSGTLFGSDSLTGGTFAFTDKNVGSGNKTVTATGVTVNDGNNGGNYNVSYADNTTSTINQLASVSWVGGSSGNWSTAANWAGGAIPDYANVAAVVIPAGVTVTHDSGVAGTTTLNSLSIHSTNTFNVSGGTLDVLSGSTSVAAFNQSGGTVHMGGALTAGTFSQTGGTWSQLAATLPSFSATDFSHTGGTFIRAIAGDGSSATPYQLADIYGVQGMGGTGMLGKTYTLANDIDATGTANWNAGAGFVPVGNPSAPFTGSFDGQNHTISNLSINRPAAEGVGLFGVAGATSAISNIGLIGSSVTGSSSVGTLVGQNSGDLSNAYATGSVTGAGNVGTLVGYNSGGSISNVYATGSVSGNYSVGGLVGYSWGSISNAYASASVAGSSYVGGLLGSNAGTVTSSYWNTTTSGQSASAGGTGLTSLQMQNTANFAGFNFTTTAGASGNNWVMVDADGTLNGSNGAVLPMLASEYATTITNTHQLQLMAMNPGASYTLGTNLDAAATSTDKDVWNSSGFVPVGHSGSTFNGSFNGQNHTISNLTINRPTTDYVGLFGNTGPSSVIRNVGLVGGSMKGSGRVGALVGRNYSSISNAYATGSVSGSQVVGGLLGSNYGSISNVYATGSVSGINGVGGLVGMNNGGSISNAYATGSVTGANILIGGLVGDNYSSITNAYATGNVTGVNLVGGLMGRNYGTVTNSYWSPTTSGQSSSAGGISLTIAQMEAQANFTGFDFTNTWVMYDGHTAPLLRSFMTSLTVTADNISKTYDGQNASPSGVSYSSTPNANLLGTLGYSDARNAGTHSIGGLYSNQQGYIINYTGGTLNITKKNVAVTGMTASSKVYDAGLTATLGGTAALVSSDIISGDNLSIGGTASGAFANKNVGTAKPVTVTGNTLSGTDAGNYNIVQQTGLTADITKKDVAVSGLTAGNKVYDAGLTATLSGTAALVSGDIISGDNLSIGGTATGAFANKNVGTTKPVTVTGNTLSGTDAGNYNIVQQTGLTADITKKDVSVSGLTASNKTYDSGLTATLGGTAALVSGDIISGDNLSIGGTAAGAFINKNVGTAKPITVTGNTLGGTDAGNYNLVQQTGLTADIIQLASVSWTGGTSGNWSDSANWAGGATPDLANVAAVVIPTGVNVTYDSGVSGTTTLSSLTSSGKLTVAAGTLATTGNLSTAGFQQTGGTVNVGGNMDIHTSSAIVMGNTHVSGNLVASSTGADISQTAGSSMSVSGTSSLIANNGQSSSNRRYGIVLNGTGNDFVGAVSVSSGKVKLVDSSGGLILDNLDVIGTANLISLGGDISQSAGSSMSISDTTTLTAADMLVAGGQRYNVVLGNSSNNFVGAVSADANQLTLVDSTGGLILGKIGGNSIQGTSGSITQANITSLGGNISQTATSSLNVTGSTNLMANNGLVNGNQRYNITLANASNDFGGAVSANAANLNLRDRNALAVALNTTGSSTLRAAGLLQLAGSVGNSLNVTNSGATSLSGALSVNGASTTTANASVTVNGTAGAVIQ
nr:YDG domain-containing protein [uncultured Rhodoferax sp.]